MLKRDLCVFSKISKKSLVAMRLAKQQKASQKAAQQLAASRDKAEAERARKFSAPNAQLSLIQAATDSEDVTAAALGARDAALLLEVFFFFFGLFLFLFLCLL